MPRPTVLTPDVVRKLLEILKLDVTMEEACLYAKISKDTVYRKMKEDQDFSDEIASSRQYATIAARHCIVKHITTDSQLAFKYLERKRRGEFGVQAPVSVQPHIMHIDLLGEAMARAEKYDKPPAMQVS